MHACRSTLEDPTLVVRQSLLLVATGLAIGYAIVRVSDRLLAKVLFDVTAADPVSTLAAGGVLLLAALVACLAPALRAARTDPAEALRTP